MVHRLAAALAALALAGGAALAQKDWDSVAANALASELAAKARNLRDTLGHEPAVARATGATDGDVARLVEAVGTLGNTARRLARALGEPREPEATRSLFLRTQKLAADAERYGRAAMPPGWVEQNLGPIQELLEELGGYYD